MLATTKSTACPSARAHSLALLLAGGILYVIGFGGPSILLSMGLGQAGSGFIWPA